MGREESSRWITDRGVIQGGPFSPDLYNLGTISLPLWNEGSESVVYADDDVELVIGETNEECQMLAQEAADKVTEWYTLVGLSINAKKSEVVGFGFNPDPVCVAGVSVQPSNTIKFLGCKIQKDLKWNDQVIDLCNQIRQAAGRIRFEGRHMTSTERRIMYNGWIGGRLLSNATAYLPLLSGRQKHEIQTACNSGVRAVAGLPRWGHFPLTETRKLHGIDSVEKTCQILTLHEGWKLQPEAILHTGLSLIHI